MAVLHWTTNNVHSAHRYASRGTFVEPRLQAWYTGDETRAQSARENLRDYANREQITILDRSGEAIPVEAFLDLALRPDLGANKRWATIAVVAIAGILVLGLVALGLVLWLT